MGEFKRLLGELKGALTKKSNRGLGIYLLANFTVILLLLGVFITKAMFGGILGGNSQVISVYSPTIIILAIPVTAIIYLLGLLTSLTRAGEWILRKQLKAKEIVRKSDKDRLYPIYNEIYQRVVKTNPEVSKDIKLFIAHDETPNACAAGQHTIILTTGLLQLTDEQIKGIIAHEFSHIINRDTTLLLLTRTGNILFNVYAIIMGIIAGVMGVALGVLLNKDGDSDSERGIWAIRIIRFILVGSIECILNWIYLLALKSSRENEFEADKFAASIGYGQYLIEALDIIAHEFQARGIMENLRATHPDTNLRIKNIEKTIEADNVAFY